MKISLEKGEGFTTLHLQGDFDGAACGAFFREIEGRLSAGDLNIVLDLKATRTMNSTAIGACIKASKELKKRGGGLVFCSPTDYTRHAIEHLGIHQLIPLFEDAAAAARHHTHGEPATARTDPATASDGKVTMLFSAVDSDLGNKLQELSDNAHDSKPAHLPERHWRGVGHKAEVDPESIQFEWQPETLGLTPDQALSLFGPGVGLSVSFGLNLLEKKRHHATIRVSEASGVGDRIRMCGTWEELDKDTSLAISRFAADLAYLRKELARAASATDKTR